MSAKFIFNKTALPTINADYNTAQYTIINKI